MTVMLSPPPHPTPGSCFSGKSLEPLTILHFTFLPPIRTPYLSQCLALDYVSFTVFSSSHHPLNRSGEGGWWEVGGGAEVEEE